MTVIALPKCALIGLSEVLKTSRLLSGRRGQGRWAVALARLGNTHDPQAVTNRTNSLEPYLV